MSREGAVPARPPIRAVLVAGLLALVAVVVPIAAPGASPRLGVALRPTPGEVIDLLPLSTSDDRRIVDTAGRDVILRGANVNSLGEYWQGVPGLEPTIAVTDDDWDQMAGLGFSVVRLLVTWSRVEPTRGTIDEAYLDLVDEHVRAAAARGIYTVIDMHQDAYSAFISTSDPADCPSGTRPAKGWDGAPAWATLTDGLSTCLTNGDRNSSPAVNRAWNNFYDNVDGIRDRFAASWVAIANRFEGRAEVAGFDLLNEPENPRAAASFTPVYNEFLAQVIEGIRAAQADAPFGHLLFVEPALPAGDVSRGLVIPDPSAAGIASDNIVAAVHNYSESISIPGIGLTIEGTNDLIEAVTSDLGVPQWGGEYGFWDTEPETLAKARRYAADEDRRAWGGAWWQWRQSCGDPHSVYWDGDQVVAPTNVQVHLNALQCPGNDDLGPTEAFGAIVGRAYPRATPGRITELRSDPDSGAFRLRANATEPGGELVVWAPTRDDDEHRVQVRGLADVSETPVADGRIITATVVSAGAYELWIGDAPAVDPVVDPEVSAAPAAEPAQAVVATPRFTG